MAERIAVVGDWNSILGFRALGLETFPVKDAQAAKDTVRELAKDMPDTLQRYKDALRPAIILIPGREGSLGIGKGNIESAIKRAIGTDI